MTRDLAQQLTVIVIPTSHTGDLHLTAPFSRGPRPRPRPHRTDVPPSRPILDKHEPAIRRAWIGHPRSLGAGKPDRPAIRNVLVERERWRGTRIEHVFDRRAWPGE